MSATSPWRAPSRNSWARWDNDAGSKIHLLANPGQDVAPIGAATQEDSLLESQTHSASSSIAAHAISSHSAAGTL